MTEDFTEEVARLACELREARMIIAALVAKHGTRGGADIRIRITDAELAGAPSGITMWRDPGHGAISIRVRA